MVKSRHWKRYMENTGQVLSKTASTGTRQAATSRKRDKGEIAPRESASGVYNDGVGGWKWEMSAYAIIITILTGATMGFTGGSNQSYLNSPRKVGGVRCILEELSDS